MKFELSAVILAAIAPSLTAQSVAKAPDDMEKVVQVSLDQVREQPDAFKSVWVKFPIQFCSIGKVANPFFTQFVPSQYTNFYAWSLDQEIWRKSEYDDVFGTLFISKDDEQLDEIYDLELYDRIMVTAVVRNVFQSKPWIEVIQFEPIMGAVNTPTLAHLYRGEAHMNRRQWNRAVSELSLASAGTVPDNVLASVHENLGVCYLRIGEAEKAVTHLRQAVALAGDNPSKELSRLYATAVDSPELQLDREIEAVEIGDHERPMWEAFASE